MKSSLREQIQKIVDILQSMQQHHNQPTVAQMQLQQQSQQLFMAMSERLIKKLFKKLFSPVKLGNKQWNFGFSLFVFCVYSTITKDIQLSFVVKNNKSTIIFCVITRNFLARKKVIKN